MTAMRVSCWRSCPGCLRFGEGGPRVKLRSLFQLRSPLLCFSSPRGKTRPGFFSFLFFLQWSPESGWREKKKFIMQRGMIYSFKICQPEFGAASGLCQMRKREALTFRDASCVNMGSHRVCVLIMKDRTHLSKTVYPCISDKRVFTRRGCVMDGNISAEQPRKGNIFNIFVQ